MSEGFDSEETMPRAPRRSCCLAGHISFGDRRNRIACDIVNMSASGAGISVADAYGLSDRFSELQDRPVALLLHADQCVVECTIVWQDRGRAGLRFRSAFRPIEAFRFG